MAADYTRIHRLLRILTLIQSQRGWTARRLALECGTTERNIFRDLKMICGAGIPCYFDNKTGGYDIRGSFFMPAVELTLDESLALAALAEYVGGQRQVPFTEAAARAIAKIRCNLPAEIQRELACIDEHLAIRLPPTEPSEGTADVYETIRQAIAGRRALSCEYESAAGDKARGGAFVFKPYVLLFSQRAWYAIGHHSARKELRCLKLSRFTRCQLTEATYEIPSGFSLKGYLGNAWRMIRGGKPYTVELQFDRQFAENIADTHWHDTQSVEYLEDGSVILRCTVDGLDEIVWWVLSMGPHCKVLKPRELAKGVCELARRLIEQYGGATVR